MGSSRRRRTSPRPSNGEIDQSLLIKAAFKEAASEWLDAKYAEIGKWTVRALGAALLTAIITFIVYTNGWKHIAVR
jgi:hypothetical protein